ncbi:MAG TPA: polyketide cyclase, partial [Elusimicrobiota bacterium]|nr:polyketide cyclase [Elusimicrobiota bacterium]
MKMFILGGLALSIGAFSIYVALKPADYLISRQLEIKASPEALFPWINNSRKTNEWMPWAALDPAMKMSFNGPEEGVGAESRWESAGKMGVGSAVV